MQKHLSEEAEKNARKREVQQAQENQFDLGGDSEKETRHEWPAPDALMQSHKLFEGDEVDLRMSKIKSLGDRNEQEQIKAQLDP